MRIDPRTMSVSLETGHKTALTDIKKENIIKYGFPIGRYS